MPKYIVMKISAGIVVCKENKIFLVRPAGPFDNGKKWSFPKGWVKDGEELWDAAVREFEEETGEKIIDNNYKELGEITKGGKRIHLFAVEQDAKWKSSNTFEFTFPNGKKKTYYETDAGKFFTIDEAKKVLPWNQKAFLPRIEELFESKLNNS